MPEIIKYACGSLRQMAESRIELDLEPGRVCEPVLLRLVREGPWVGGDGLQRSLWTSLQEKVSLKAAQGNRLCGAQLLKDVFSIWSCLLPFVP